MSEWHRRFFFNAAHARHRRSRSAAYVALTAKEFDPTVAALKRFAAESGLELTTANALRAGVQREHSKVTPFHAALLVGSHVAPCVGTAARFGCVGADDVAYVTVVRDPLRFAQDFFYRTLRRHAAGTAAQKKSSTSGKDGRGIDGFRHERPGHFSDEHLQALEVFASQRPKLLLATTIGRNVLQHRPQYTHFLSSVSPASSSSSSSSSSSPGVDGAAHVVRLFRFLVGFEDNLDHFLVMLRARLGWQFRQLLALRSEERAVEKRQIFSAGLAGWPLSYVLQLNRTKAVQADWEFVAAMRRHSDEQRAAFGAARLARETVQLREVSGALEAVCDPRRARAIASSPSSPSKKLPASLIETTIKQMQIASTMTAPCNQASLSASADALAATIRGALNGEGAHAAPSSSKGRSDRDRCSQEPSAVFRCMLDQYDTCKAGVGPKSLCDYFDDS